MAKQEPRLEKAGAGATSAEVKGKIIEFAWHLKKNGYREATIRGASKELEILARRGANILDSESVKEVIANQPWAESRKLRVVNLYTLFLKMLGETWNPPKYKPVRKLPFIPTEKSIDQLISACGKKTSTFLQLLKETGMRSGEANKLVWNDIDFERCTVNITPEKNGNPRILKVSRELVGRLKALPRTSDRVFGNRSYNSPINAFCQQRRRIAKRLNNPQITRIHFHTLRHWYATKLYYQTKDILLVKTRLGHKRIDSTLLYVQLAEVVYGKGELDNFVCKTAKTAEEISELIEAGFEYVTETDDLKFFRKRK